MDFKFVLPAVSTMLSGMNSDVFTNSMKMLHPKLCATCSMSPSAATCDEIIKTSGRIITLNINIGYNHFFIPTS